MLQLHSSLCKQLHSHLDNLTWEVLSFIIDNVEYEHEPGKLKNVEEKIVILRKGIWCRESKKIQPLTSGNQNNSSGKKSFKGFTVNTNHRDRS